MSTTTFSKEPKYTVKDASEMLGLTKHTIRYYENEKLLPYVSRNERNIRLFSELDIEWFKIINCLRYSGLPIVKIKHYLNLALEGDGTIPQRAKIIFEQEKALEEKAKELAVQLEIIKKKKIYYEELLASGDADKWNPLNQDKYELKHDLKAEAY